MSIVSELPPATRPRPHRPFRAAVFRGLGGFIPPLLTVVVILWMFGTVDQYVLAPVQLGTTKLIAKYLERQLLHAEEEGDLGDIATIRGAAYEVRSDGRDRYIVVKGVRYFHLPDDNSFASEDKYRIVLRADGFGKLKDLNGFNFCFRFAELRYMRWYYVLPAFLALFTLFLYLLGKLLAGRLGQFVWGNTERLISRVPLVRNVYSSVKQVTEFFFNQRELEFTRVVAVEYPRKHCWSLGFVTGESLMDVTAAAGEPLVSVLIPTSPMPVTGFTCIVLKREVVDLNITIDQALEYIISCGVVVPPHQVQLAMRQKNEKERSRKINAERVELTNSDGQTLATSIAEGSPASG